jgi:autotransporter-associated beta strand protein
MLRKIRILSISVPALYATSAFATDWNYTAQGSQATEITGGYGAVGNPSTGAVYNDGTGDSSYAVILDSGSSGFLMSETVTDEFDVPLQPGQTYTETGIGGSEVENVTEPLTSYYAPISDSDPDNTSTMTSFGTYTFESRQSDPLEGYVYFDIIGTPIIQNQVMVVTPSQTKNLFQSTLGALTAETVLQPTDPVLPTQGLYHIPITWTNFVTGTPVPSEGLNPVVEGVTARGPSNTDVANNWVFDSGAQFTIISPTYASQLGINMSDPTSTITGEGVGGSTVTFDGFQITDITLPLSNGDSLVFDNPVVYVPVDTTLPDGLTGILGENLWMQSTNKINQLTGKPKGTFAPLFSEWYLDGPGSQLVLYDPNSTYNAGATALIWNGGGADDNWTTAANWSGTTLVANDSLEFAGTTQLAPNNNSPAGTQYAGITFNAGAGPFVIGGNAINLAGNVVNNSTSLQTININLALQQNATFNAASDDFVIGGGISGAYSLTKLGSHTLTLEGTNNYSGQTIVSAGTLVIAAPGALPANTAVNIAGSAIMQIAPNIGKITLLSSLTIATGGELDITNNQLFIDYGSGPDPIASIAAWIANGFYGLSGPQIISSSIATADAASGLSYGIGYADSADPGNPANLPGGTIEIMFTLLGDANLDGTVNAEDYTLFSQNLGQSGMHWDEGDFNYDGTVNAEDYTLFSQNLGQSAQAGALETNTTLLANLPEPASVGLIMLTGLGILRRRRRRSHQHPAACRLQSAGLSSLLRSAI